MFAEGMRRKWKPTLVAISVALIGATLWGLRDVPPETNCWRIKFVDERGELVKDVEAEAYGAWPRPVLSRISFLPVWLRETHVTALHTETGILHIPHSLAPEGTLNLAVQAPGYRRVHCEQQVSEEWTNTVTHTLYATTPEALFPK
jgi:hypothetical protein